MKRAFYVLLHSHPHTQTHAPKHTHTTEPPLTLSLPHPDTAAYLMCHTLVDQMGQEARSCSAHRLVISLVAPHELQAQPAWGNPPMHTHCMHGMRSPNPILCLKGLFHATHGTFSNTVASLCAMRAMQCVVKSNCRTVTGTQQARDVHKVL